MTKSSISFKAGTRPSNLARVQTRDALDHLEALLPGTTFEMITVSSPGDRDRTTDLKDSPQDFFTRDLDDALLGGDLDCAVHSAKDLPNPMPEGIDWCWLPWREDARDTIILTPGQALNDLPAEPVVGISSERREAWCVKQFPKAQMKPIRGNIEERISQLDNGDFEMILMAGAALNRLGLQDRITEWISLDDLPAPAGQGFLAMTFREDDERLLALRNLLITSTVFAGAGGGAAGLCTQAAIEAVERCEVCLHDALMDPAILAHLPTAAKRINVGKRSGKHSLEQKSITSLITDYARRGRRVVRLKGGDPGIFGRLAEEVEAMDALHLPYRVIPGISSLQTATTGTGMLLTRRGLTRGFSVMTPRKEGGNTGPVNRSARADLPIVFFMAIKRIKEVCDQLLEDGMAPTTPAAVVFGAGRGSQKIIRGTVETLADQAPANPTDLAGLILIGETTSFSYGTYGPLAGHRILLTCSDALQSLAIHAVQDYDGIPLSYPLVKLDPVQQVAQLSRLTDYDWLVLTSPSAVRCFKTLLSTQKLDIRHTPKTMACGTGTARELRNIGLTPDAMPESGFSATTVTEAMKKVVTPETRILRLRSEKAGPALADALTGLGAQVDDVILYRNSSVSYESLPNFDVVFFASSSAVDSYIDQFGVASLEDKTVLTIGVPTTKTAETAGIPVDVVGKEATVESAIQTLAAALVSSTLTGGGVVPTSARESGHAPS